MIKMSVELVLFTILILFLIFFTCSILKNKLPSITEDINK